MWWAWKQDQFHCTLQQLHMLLRAAWSSCSPGPSPLWIHSMYESADLVVWCLAGAFRCHPSAPEGVHQLPQLSVHFPQCFVGFFLTYILFNIFYFMFSSGFPFLTRSSANPVALPPPLPYDVLYDALIQSFLCDSWILPSQLHFSHKMSKSLQFTKSFGVYAVSWFFYNTAWDFFSICFQHISQRKW